MTAEYQKPDYELVDYKIYSLDNNIIDPVTKKQLLLRGPKPDLNSDYFAVIGAAQVFGRFCAEPFPDLLGKKLGLELINLGRGGAGPFFFIKNDSLINYLNRAKFVIIQVMSGRSESNSVFRSDGIGYYTKISDGTNIGCDEAFKQILESKDTSYIKKIVQETREAWIDNYKLLIEKITVPTILFWFSERLPHYEDSYEDVYALFNKFPQLVNKSMVDNIKQYSDNYVECVSTRGLPQYFFSRFNVKQIKIEDPWGEVWESNWYYPSPEMHQDAANVLESVCKEVIN